MIAQIKLVTTTLRDIDPDIWKKFKMKCLENDVSANSKIKELINEYADKKG